MGGVGGRARGERVVRGDEVREMGEVVRVRSWRAGVSVGEGREVSIVAMKEVRGADGDGVRSRIG